MSLIYKHSILPDNETLNTSIGKSADSLKEALLKLDIDTLNVADYTKKYFKDYLRKLDYALQSCSLIVSWSIHNSNKDKNEMTFVDNGAGVGILAMLAKAVGIKNVIYHDIYDVSARDAETIATAAGYKADFYLVGDTPDLVNFINEKRINCDTIASRNVIEHIYDLDDYFKTISKINSPNLNLFLATTANNKNILTDLYTKDIQRKIETKGYIGKWQKDRDSRKSYIEIRKEIIKQLLPKDSKDLEKLTAFTRGLRKDDIERKVKEFIETGKLPEPINHPTNTCDPITGNWTEHLVELDEYKRLFEKHGFSFTIIPGFYNTKYNLPFINYLTPILNKLIKRYKNKGVYLAPFIGLTGKRS
jgi:2-polyprenyl-3-methyl-5-hydroxy-6-metoxy-1,4-benzoquinol methylase